MPAPVASRFVRLAVLPVLIAGTLVAASGCASEGAPPRYAPPADSTAWAVTGDTVMTRLAQISFAAVDSAFAALPRVPVTRTTRTDVFSATDSLRGQLRQIWAHRPGAEPALRSETQTGTLPDRDLWGLAPRTQAEALPENIIGSAYPDEPPFLEARNRSAYRYGMRRDTLAPGIAVDRLEVLARDTADGRRLAVPYARVDVLPGTNTVVSTYVVRAERALLYDEDSLFYVALQPGSEVAWLPHLLRFRARLAVPLRPVESVQLVTSFTPGT